MFFSLLWTLSCEWHETALKIPFWFDQYAYQSIFSHPRLQAVIRFGPPAVAQLRHQGAPSSTTSSPGLSPSPASAHGVFPRGGNITLSLSQLKNERRNLHRILKICFISIVSNPQQIDSYFFLSFSNLSMKKTAANPVESLSSINQVAVFIMLVTVAPVACGTGSFCFANVGSPSQVGLGSGRLQLGFRQWMKEWCLHTRKVSPQGRESRSLLFCLVGFIFLANLFVVIIVFLN